MRPERALNNIGSQRSTTLQLNAAAESERAAVQSIIAHYGIDAGLHHQSHNLVVNPTASGTSFFTVPTSSTQPDG